MDGYVYFFSMVGFVVLFWLAIIIPVMWMVFSHPKK